MRRSDYGLRTGKEKKILLIFQFLCRNKFECRKKPQVTWSLKMEEITFISFDLISLITGNILRSRKNSKESRNID